MKVTGVTGETPDVTATTITDQQCRESGGEPFTIGSAIGVSATIAPNYRRWLRGKCAAAWNARHGGGR